MSDQLPVRKYVSVHIARRKNPPRKGGKCTESYTLEWVEYGKRRFMSLGARATLAYARQARVDKEKELNDSESRSSLEPITFGDFVKKYLDTKYPGHDLPPRERKTAAASWANGLTSMRPEKRTMTDFDRIVMKSSGRQSTWCHDITSADREKFVSSRINELPSGESVDADLRNLRKVFNVMEEWKHRSEGSNPFQGRGKATIGVRRKRAKGRTNQAEKKAEYYTRGQIVALLDQADKEIAELPGDWKRLRLRALIYFSAYTGARIGEILHLKWTDIDFDEGIALFNWTPEHRVKTEGSEAPVGLPDALLEVLREWKKHQKCQWVFPNEADMPWITGAPGYKNLDQLKAIAKRAGVEHATWKMFRHSLSTHGKQWFGITREQMRVQLRHEDERTQRHYDHADLENLRGAVKDIDFRAT